MWLVRLYAGTDPEAKKGAGGATENVRTITFAQAVAEGIIPASGEAMSGQVATSPEGIPGLADTTGSR